jgi:hypothetical protein
MIDSLCPPHSIAQLLCSGLSLVITPAGNAAALPVYSDDAAAKQAGRAAVGGKYQFVWTQLTGLHQWYVSR